MHILQQKSYKQDKRLLKIESDERVTRISTAANYYGDSTMLFKINHDSFKEQAFYHNQCMTKYLVGVKQESEVNDNSSSDIEAAFSQLVNDISEDLLKSKKAFLLSLLDMMFSYLPEHVPKDLTTRKLQRKLESHYGESIVIQSQQGQVSQTLL